MKPILTAVAVMAALLMAPAVAATDTPAGPYDRLIADAKSTMMQDPAAALKLAQRAAALAVQPLPKDRALAVARAEWLQGEALSRLDRQGEALPVLEHGLATVVHLAPTDRLRGDILLSRGWVEEARGGIAAGLADFQQAFLIYRDAGEARGQAKALQNIAGIYQDAGDNQHAQRFYAQAAEIYHGDPAFALAAYNNVGESLRLLGRYAAAERQYELALASAREVDSPLLEANILTNLASTHLARGDAAGATRLANRALALSHEREAEDERPFVYGVLAQIAVARRDYAAAATLIDRTFEGVDLTTSSIRYRDFHRLAADIYAREGRPERALAHMRAWKRLDDNVRAVAASTNAALMAARFDFSTQNLRIAQLQANRARLHETVLIIVVSAVSLVSTLLLAGIVSLRRSRNQIRAANRDLTKALQAKSDFLAMTSHEIRTPLNGILGMTQVMLADRQLAEPMRCRVEVVHGAGETMRALVDDILDLSKMDSGKLIVDRAPVRLKALIDETVALWRGKAEAKGLSLDVDVTACPGDIEEDGDRLRQILFNLLSNAVKFTEAGGVRLIARGAGDTLEVVVSDTGIGIAPEHHELIFEKFQQADASTTRRFGGTGLGLAICRNLADAMGGSITVDSGLGDGATFTLRLPLRVIDTGCAEAPSSEAAAAKVLLFEPNALNQRVIAKIVREHGAEVDVIADPQEVITSLRSGAFTQGVVQHAPLGQALGEVLEAARSTGTRLIILCTAEEMVDEALLDGVATLLRKPFGAPALAAALRSPAGKIAQMPVAA